MRACYVTLAALRPASCGICRSPRRYNATTQSARKALFSGRGIAAVW
jgi:hypothetical protein